MADWWIVADVLTGALVLMILERDSRGTASILAPLHRNSGVSKVCPVARPSSSRGKLPKHVATTTVFSGPPALVFPTAFPTEPLGSTVPFLS